MADALIIFASLTGNTEEMAEIVAAELEANDINVEILDVMQADAEDFLDYDICLVGSYTYGVDGVLPDEMIDFHEELGELDLTDKIFGVFGSGDDFYEVFWSEKHGYILLGMSGDGTNVFDEASIIPTSEAFVKRMLTEIASDYFISTDSDNTLKTATQPEAVEIQQRWKPYMEQLPEYQHLLDTLVIGSAI